MFEDEDENMIEGFDDNPGSSTGSELDEEDLDNSVYQDERDILDDLDSDSDHHISDHQRSVQPSATQQHGAQDDVLPGIEDKPMSDVNDLARSQEDDEGSVSDASSTPSEFPIRREQPLGDGRETTHGLEAEDVRDVGFSFHLDGEEEEDDDDEAGEEPW